MQLRQSMRRAAKMRLALAGASGSGKTYSSLLIAYGKTDTLGRMHSDAQFQVLHQFPHTLR